MKFDDENIGAICRISMINHAYEHMVTRKGFFSKNRLFSRHNIDVIIFIILYVMLFLAAVVIVLRLSDAAITPALGPGEVSNKLQINANTIQFVFGAAIFGACVNLISKLIESAQKRLGTVDLFISEILSIGRVFTSGSIVTGLIFYYDRINVASKESQTEEDAIKYLAKFPIRYGEAIRKENYLSIFDKNSQDLGPLDAEVVTNVTAFYTFLRASRDATGMMSLWTKENYDLENRKYDIVAIVYYCLLLAIHGRKSLENLIENRHTKEYALNVFNTIELQAYLFLINVLPPFDVRLRPLRERQSYYESLIINRIDKNLSRDLLVIINGK